MSEVPFPAGRFQHQRVAKFGKAVHGAVQVLAKCRFVGQKGIKDFHQIRFDLELGRFYIRIGQDGADDLADFSGVAFEGEACAALSASMQRHPVQTYGTLCLAFCSNDGSLPPMAPATVRVSILA